MKAQEFLAAGALLLVFFQGFELLFHLVEFFGFGVKVLAQFQGVGVGIQKVEVRTAVEEGEVVALAVNIDQQTTYLAQERLGDGVAVYPYSIGAFAAELAVYDQGIFVSRQLFFRQQFFEGGEVFLWGEAKDTFDLGLVGAVADDFLVGFAGQQELYGVNDQGLAGSGFAGDDIQSIIEPPVHVLDDAQVFDSQFD
ncbi:hypothetical protein ES703_92928 [subsurface metagenome]